MTGSKKPPHIVEIENKDEDELTEEEEAQWRAWVDTLPVIDVTSDPGKVTPDDALACFSSPGYHEALIFRTDGSEFRIIASDLSVPAVYGAFIESTNRRIQEWWQQNNPEASP